jgi:hypothetical protein
MGSRCTQAPFLDGNPAKLRSSSLSTVCDRCVQEGVPGDLPAEVPAVKEPPTYLSRCHSCGKPEVKLLDAWVCEECAELLRAARVLLEKEAPEDQVFPTLAFAGYALGQGIEECFAEKARLVKAWGKPKTWKTEVDRFVSRFPSARPVQVIDDVLILEQEPVTIKVVRYPHTDIPEVVEIHVYQRRDHTEPEEIARRYEHKLSAAGIPCDVVDRLLPMSAEPFEGRVIITVANHKHDTPPSLAEALFRGEPPRFQHPEGVGAYCKLAIGSAREGSNGFARDLNRRGGKRPRSNEWLVSASVVIYLREIAQIEDKRTIYWLLNEYVFGKKRFLGNGSDTGRINTLWQYVDDYPARVRLPLSAAERAFDLTG